MAAYTGIDDPSLHFQIMLYAGSQGGSDPADGSTESYTFTDHGDGVALKPDWMWFKGRNYANDWTAWDSTRGFGSNGSENNGASAPSVTGNEATAIWGGGAVYGYVKSFNTDGFTGESGSVGAASRAPWGYASQCMALGWKANGGTTSSNSDGSITSTVQANTDAGFSIVQYTGTGSAATVGHGLGVKPDVLICRNTTTSMDWAVYHTGLSDNGYELALNTTAAQHDVGNDYWNETDPTTSVFSVGDGSFTNQNNNEIICYAFASKQGFSKFGTYYGNGQHDGTFVYTGFKPRAVLIKQRDDVEPWILYDTKRDTYNPTTLKISPDTHHTENTAPGIGDGDYNFIDILSNGFKCRHNSNAANGSGDEIVYFAWAEAPLVSSGGVPCTAR